MATTPPTTLPPIDIYPEGEGNVMPSHLHDLALAILSALLRGLFAPRSLVVRELPVMNNPHDLRDYVEPDLMVVFDVGELDPVYGVLRRQYRVWHEGRVPDLVVEAASKSTVGRDRAGKKDEYAAIGVREYVQLDPTGEYLRPRVQVFALGADGRYEAVAAQPDGAVPSTVMPYDWVLAAGNLLRLRDRATGQLVPTAEERAVAAEEELARLRAELARRPLSAEPPATEGSTTPQEGDEEDAPRV